MTREQFRALLVHPLTGPLLDRMLADNARIDGPRQCCGEFGIIAQCDGATDEFYCGICERVWQAPCRP